jgi:hypothetical protein
MKCEEEEGVGGAGFDRVCRIWLFARNMSSLVDLKARSFLTSSSP